MRTRILLGLLALTFGVFANSVSAGNVADCDVLTDPDPENDLYAPKLYGLCVAWHNANENAKPALAARFSAHAEKLYGLVDFEVPGSLDFSCPCWASDLDIFGVTEEDICTLGPDSSSYGESGFIDVDFRGSGSQQYFAAVTGEPPGCARIIRDSQGTMTNFIPLDGEQNEPIAGVCFAEVLRILDLFDDCPVVEP